MKAILDWLKANAVALVITGALLFAGRLWLQEHDARLQADTQFKSAQTVIDGLKQQQTEVAQAAKSQVVALQKKAKAVQTPTDAVKALTTPETVKEVTGENSAPLEATELPDAPDKVAVKALALYQDLNTCKQTEVNFDACVKELRLQKQITVQKDTQINDLKKKPGFLKRLGKAVKVVGCSAAGGAVGSIAGGKGAAIGAGVGAGICQAF